MAAAGFIRSNLYVTGCLRVLVGGGVVVSFGCRNGLLSRDEAGDYVVLSDI